MQAMEKYDCNNIVFSSSATVYGDPERVPIVETDNKGDKILTTNPYGTTKLFIERIMTDAQKANPKLSVTLLRYFNPIGAHERGIMGEDPKGIPNNLLPYIAQVAVGKLEKVHVFGNDYPTPDGTGVRDYIHVVDVYAFLARAMFNSLNVTDCKVNNVDIVTNACTVRSRVIVTENVNFFKLTYCNLCNVRK